MSKTPKFEARALRNAFGAFATGVTVITTRQSDGTPRGLTANSFTAVSLDPPLLLVCIAKSAYSCSTFTEASHFAVNILGEEQKDISGLFASREPDKFERCDWRPGTSGVPLIDNAIASFCCARHNLVDAGDHIILIGQVTDFAKSDGAPLGFFGGNYFTLGLQSPLVDAITTSQHARIGAVLNCDGKLLLHRNDDGSLALPIAPAERLNIEGLCQDLAKRGLTCEIDFLYTVFEDRALGCHGIYYHGQVSGEVADELILLVPDAIPLDQVSDISERSMLQRYAKEYEFGSFGIYLGNETKGTVRRVTHESS